MAFKFGLKRCSSTRKRSNSLRYSSSSILAAGPLDAACFSDGNVSKSIATAAADWSQGASCCVGALAGWLGASAMSWSASKPPRISGTSTSSRTLWRKMSVRVSFSFRRSVARSTARFSSAMSSCRFSLPSCRNFDNALSDSRSASAHWRALASTPCISAERESASFLNDSCFAFSCSISAKIFGAKSAGRRSDSSRIVCSIIESSATTFRCCLANSSDRN
mmetsp:Transcript_81832/g.227952  ORF Transcript_81832/g.227952 Transcript_81832/m.227952 type:complete len:221 (+) Transcript_81832:717-1379(+)